MAAADNSIEMRVAMLEQMLGQLLADQMAANANGGGASDMNVPVFPIIGGSAGGMCGNFAFDEAERKIKDGCVLMGRTASFVTGKIVPEDYTGGVYLKVGIGGRGQLGIVKIVLEDIYAEDPVDYSRVTRTTSYVPLYEFENGSIKDDYRGAPTIQQWESSVDEDDQ